LEDKDKEREEERIVLGITNLSESKYVNFETTLRNIISEEEINNFGYEVIDNIREQRQKHENVTKMLNEGEEAFKNNNIEHAKEVLKSLEELTRGQERVFGSKKLIAINKLRGEIRLNSSQQEQKAQVVQDPK